MKTEGKHAMRPDFRSDPDSGPNSDHGTRP
jgi:hypothetical protein